MESPPPATQNSTMQQTHIDIKQRSLEKNAKRKSSISNLIKQEQLCIEAKEENKNRMKRIANHILWW